VRLFGPIGWALFGALIGVASIFIRNLLRAPMTSAGPRIAMVRGERPDQQAQDQMRQQTQDRLRQD
jgi:hypothetical protein